MSDEDVPVTQVGSTSDSTAGKWILLFLAIIYVAGSLYFLFDLRGRAEQLSKAQSSTRADIIELTRRVQAAQAESETLGEQLGMTKKELAARASELQRQQRAAESRLAEQQKQQITEVTGQVAGVKTDVGGVKSDVASARSELEATKKRLDTAIGDLGLQSGLIARTRDDLELLKHRGDRNYYEFTLEKGARPSAISTVALQLKKTDQKRGKYTLNVTADDKTIEKKDRTINEPIQFYTGRDHLLYELVIWSVDKKKATGYLTTPKNAPVPVTAGQ